MTDGIVSEYDEVETGGDPTKAVLSESALKEKHLCDYVVNVATGCRHGCRFCYVPSTPAIRTRPDMLEEKANVQDPQKDWGNYVLYRDDLPERLDDHLDAKTTWKSTENGCGIVGISFSTDCYMDGRAGEITRNAIDVLSTHDKYARVLTRNPILALQDVDIFQKAGEFVTIGSSIPSLDAQEVSALEPRAPPPSQRLKGLNKFNEMGVSTYVSMSPTYPTQSKDDLRKLLAKISECDPAVVFHEPINPRGGNFELTVEAARESGQNRLAEELSRLRQRENWIQYSLQHLSWVQELSHEIEIPIHLWPDKQLVKYTSGETKEWLEYWRNRQSPEDFANRNTPHQRIPQNSTVPV